MRPIQAATATPLPPGGGYLILAVVVAAGGYLIACAIWPFTSCGRCDGSGKHRSPSGKAWRNCRRCKGSGARLRIGRRLWNYWCRSAQAASKE